MSQGFEPSGERARWRMAYDVFAGLDVGQIAKYEELAEALGLDSEADRSIIQSAVRRAARTLLRDRKHKVEVEPKVGYRVVEPGERVEPAKGRADHVDFREVTALGLLSVVAEVAELKARLDRLEARGVAEPAR